LDALGYACQIPVVVDDFAFLLFLPLAAIGPKNSNQYQKAVSDFLGEVPM